MLYLKNTLGGLSRSLADSALNSFQGRHRWWKLALFAGLIVLPGGSVGVAILAWIEHRRTRKRGGGSATAGQTADARQVAEKPGAAAGVGSRDGSRDGSRIRNGITNGIINCIANDSAAPSAANPAGACASRGDAPCRAAAGKLARKSPSTDARA